MTYDQDFFSNDLLSPAWTTYTVSMSVLCCISMISTMCRSMGSLSVLIDNTASTTAYWAKNEVFLLKCKNQVYMPVIDAAKIFRMENVHTTQLIKPSLNYITYNILLLGRRIVFKVCFEDTVYKTIVTRALSFFTLIHWQFI